MDRELSISDVVKPEIIKLRIEARDREDVVRRCGKTMLENGIIEERYIDAMIRVLKELGPYIVVCPGVAIPHAGPDDGAKKVGLAVITLKNPITFGNEKNDPVKVCFAFATPDKKQHVKILGSIARILQNKEDMERIANAQTPEEVIKVLVKYEQ